jgi:uncharacterized protein
MELTKILLIVLGTLSLFVGIAGIVVPGLPTTPFILLTAGMYIRSSDKLYQRLIGNKIIGAYIVEYRKRKGMSLRAKISAIGTMWVMIGISCLFFQTAIYIKVLIFSFGLVGSAVMVFFVPTGGDPDEMQ